MSNRFRHLVSCSTAFVVFVAGVYCSCANAMAARPQPAESPAAAHACCSGNEREAAQQQPVVPGNEHDENCPHCLGTNVSAANASQSAQSQIACPALHLWLAPSLTPPTNGSPAAATADRSGHRVPHPPTSTLLAQRCALTL
jgi:hypothetical protein